MGDPAANKVNVLLIGGGGREHALAIAIARSQRLGTLYATHRANPGIAALSEPVDVPVNRKEIYRLVQFCDAKAIDLVVIGPEGPLAEGFADALARSSSGKPRAVFGPTKAAAQLEADKAYAKQIMRAASIPTAEGRVFENPDFAEEYLKTRDEPQVIKAAGLAAGKGVVLPSDLDEGLAAIDRMMRQRQFGDAGRRIIIEERLQGEEVSVLALCDGHHIMTLPPCRDHKRLLDNDAGPNTGGMGAVCPASRLDEPTLLEIERDILVPAIDALRREDIEYRGVLYAGLMLTPAGPKVLEFNVRFGDPECQPLMTLLDSDMIDLLLATAAGRLDNADIRFRDACAVSVVIASDGYPRSPTLGVRIDGVEQAEAVDGVTIHYAGATRQGESLVTSGGRILSVTAEGSDLAQARERAYTGAEAVKIAGSHYRRDIAERAATAPHR